tara:strand:+ start:624 stop:1199 length:576 start_codon:yes stop_codon:yes gene_type:complete
MKKIILLFLFIPIVSSGQDFTFGINGNPIDGDYKYTTANAINPNNQFDVIKFVVNRKKGTGTTSIYFVLSSSEEVNKIILKFSNEAELITLSAFAENNIIRFRRPVTGFCKLISKFQNASSVYVRFLGNGIQRNYNLNLSGSKKAIDYVLLEKSPADNLNSFCKHFCDIFDDEGNYVNPDFPFVDCDKYDG